MTERWIGRKGKREREEKEKEAPGFMEPQRARGMYCAEIGGKDSTYISLTHSHSLLQFTHEHRDTHTL